MFFKKAKRIKELEKDFNESYHIAKRANELCDKMSENNDWYREYSKKMHDYAVDALNNSKEILEFTKKAVACNDELIHLLKENGTSISYEEVYGMKEFLEDLNVLNEDKEDIDNE